MSKNRFRKVLLVENDPDLQQFMSTLVSSYEYEVFAVADRKRALKRIAETTPDLILMGFDLPGLDLQDFLAALKISFPEVRLILYAAENPHDIANNFGVKYWAVKPLRVGELKAVLEMCFGGGTSSLLQAIRETPEAASGKE